MEAAALDNMGKMLSTKAGITKTGQEENDVNV